jgi:hypothetical protein
LRRDLSGELGSRSKSPRATTSVANWEARSELPCAATSVASWVTLPATRQAYEAYCMPNWSVAISARENGALPLAGFVSMMTCASW